jgi:tRNA1(Val) A37 N6-methylase TrmN6
MSRPVSVWACAQSVARTQRRGRYLPGTTAHPAKMLPALAAYAITELTRPGELVFDPMCGAGTTLVESVHHGRHAVGVDIEPRWAQLARRNLALAHELGARGSGQVLRADARGLPDNLPEPLLDQLRGRVRLVLTSPPYGPSTHGQVEVRPGAGVVKSDYRYARHAHAANLAYQPLPQLCAGLEAILAGCRPLLAPDGYVVITARPWRRHGELIDLPAAVTTAADNAGYELTQRCVALLAGLRDGALVTRASFFQRDAVSKARAAGIPRQLICHEDTLIYQQTEKYVGSESAQVGASGAPRAADQAAAPVSVASYEVP